MSALEFSIVEVKGSKPAWKLREGDEPRYRYSVELAVSGAARCSRGCGELIAKGTIRIGEPSKDSRGEFGVIASWKHLNCTRVPKGDVCDCQSEVFGFEKLSKQQQKEVSDELAKTDTPAHLVAIDPEDPAFLKLAPLPRVKAPDSIVLDLLPYQEEGYGWMVKQEKEHQCKGGILADEMGMGKTLQTICLLCSDLEGDKTNMANKKGKGKSATTTTSSSSSSAVDTSASENDTSNTLIKGPTLVVVPSSAMWQWYDEMVKSTKENTLKICMYHGSGRKLKEQLNSLEGFQKYDVVVTTYPVVEYEYRVEFDRAKVKCEYCDKMMLPRKLEFHLKWFCGPYSRRSAKQQLTERKGGDEVADKVSSNKRGGKKVKQSQATMNKGMKALGVANDMVLPDENIDVGSDSNEEDQGQTSLKTSKSKLASKESSNSKKKGATGVKMKKPFKNKTAYILWKESHLKQAKKDSSSGSDSLTSKQLADLFKSLKEEEANEWKELASQDKARYDEAMVQYEEAIRNSVKDSNPDDNDCDDDDDDDDASSKKKTAQSSSKKSKGTFDSSVPTLTNIYREIMHNASRDDEALRMYERKQPPSNATENVKQRETEKEKELSKENGRVVISQAKKKAKTTKDHYIGTLVCKKKSPDIAPKLKKLKKAEVSKKTAYNGSGKKKKSGKKIADSESESEHENDDYDSDSNYFFGKVTAYDDPYYLVTYEDGDDEEVDEKEMLEMITLMELRQKKSNNLQKKPSSSSSSSSSVTTATSVKKIPRALLELASVNNYGKKEEPFDPLKVEIDGDDAIMDEDAPNRSNRSSQRKKRKADDDNGEVSTTTATTTLVSSPVETVDFSPPASDTLRKKSISIKKKTIVATKTKKSQVKKDSKKKVLINKKASDSSEDLSSDSEFELSEKSSDDDDDDDDDDSDGSDDSAFEPGSLRRASMSSSSSTLSKKKNQTPSKKSTIDKTQKKGKKTSKSVSESDSDEGDNDDSESRMNKILALVEKAVELRDTKLKLEEASLQYREKTKSKRRSSSSSSLKKKVVSKGSSSSSKKAKKKSNKKYVDSSSDSENSDEDGDDTDTDEDDEEEKTKANISSFMTRGLVSDGEGVDLGNSPLHCTNWNRIVLDEAHKIKGRVNTTSKAVNALTGDKRWCLTGTPIQNRVQELFGLIRFLKHDPYAYYTCRTKGCNCKKLDWQFGSRGAYCVDCGHSPMMHSAHFNQHILNPITKCGYAGAGASAMMKLRAEVLLPIMLRRTKVEKSTDLKLPPLSVKVVTIELDEAERDFYQCVYMRTQSKFSTYVKKGSVLHNYAHIFELLSRLRQALDHPYLVISGPSAHESSIQVASSKGNSDVCGVCHLDILSAKDCAVASCRHTFHRECILDYLEENKNSMGYGKASPQSANKKGGKSTASGKGGKGGQKNQSSASSAKDVLADSQCSDCPICFQPLSLTLDIRGADDSDEEEAPPVATSRKGKNAAKAEAIVANMDESGSMTKKVPECRACFDKPRDALYLPCGHMVLCMECTGKLSNKCCPLCRAHISKVVKAKNHDDIISHSNDNTDKMKTEETVLAAAEEGEEGGEIDSLFRSSAATSKSKSKLKDEPKTKKEVMKSRHQSQGGQLASDALTVGRSTILQKLNMSQFQSSSKIEAVVKGVQSMIENNPTDKGIIFSQYRTMIDLVEWRLRNANIEVVKLMGDMNLGERRSVLAAFKQSSTIKVILMSLKTGGEGLNLQAANHVFLLEPWWNPAVEMQAIHRAYRIGQNKPVFATRFVTSNSVEEKMMMLQTKKQLVFEGTMDGSAAALSKLTAEDLAFLFHS